MSHFLLELLCEEIPARMQAGARNDLARLFAQELDELGVTAEAIDVWSTPRRLALVARGLPLDTQPVSEEVKGPRTNAPQQALEGFLRKVGLPHEQLQDRDGVWFAVVEKAGQPMRDLLGSIVERIVRAFPWPKSMRWGAASESTASLRWVRPLHGIVALLGEDIVPVQIDGVTAGATTVGHRFHHPGPITIGSSHDYAEKLRACHVIVDHEEREKIVREGAQKAATDAGLRIVEDEGLVVENAGLTEWPVPLLGRFDADYLDVPREVIVLTMRTNQKYFACTDDAGMLAPAFVCVANIDAKDCGEAIVEGNRRVLAARLADARFFWEQDLKVPLEEQAAKLSGIVFHEKLGTVADKVERVAKLARWLVEEGIVGTLSPAGRGQGEGARASSTHAEPPHPNPLPAGEREQLADQAERAARLAKADLVTGMVGEFPELQGIVGGYIAERQGEPTAVAEAIRDHYKPVGQGDEVPTAPVTVAVALADKLDTLLGFFARGIRPTGSKDPFALRRAALSILALITRNHVRLDWELFTDWVGLYFVDDPTYENEAEYFAFFEKLAERDKNYRRVGYPDRIQLFYADELLRTIPRATHADATAEMVWGGYDEFYDFLVERLEVQQRSEGVRLDVLRSVIALTEGSLTQRENDFVRLLTRVKALEAFVEGDDGADLLTAYRRAANILKKEQWKPTAGADGSDMQPEEAALIKALDAVEPHAGAAVDAEDFTAAMRALAQLRRPVDAFFDKVTVNDPDPMKRERRLNLLARLRDAVDRVADFSKIDG